MAYSPYFPKVEDLLHALHLATGAVRLAKAAGMTALPLQQAQQPPEEAAQTSRNTMQLLLERSTGRRVGAGPAGGAPAAAVSPSQSPAPAPAPAPPATPIGSGPDLHRIKAVETMARGRAAKQEGRGAPRLTFRLPDGADSSTSADDDPGMRTRVDGDTPRGRV